MRRPPAIFRRSRLCLAAVASVLALALGACAGADVVGPREASERAQLVIDCEVEDASVWVDGRYLGPIGALGGGVMLSPGTRRVEIRHDDYHTHYARITLEPQEQRHVEVHLAPELR